MKNYKYTLSFFLYFIFMSCNPNKSEVELPINEDKLLGLMVDLTLSQAAVSNYPSNQKDSMRNVYKYQLEVIYQMPMTQIDSLLQIVYQDIELNKKMQKQVLDTLKVLEEKTKRIK